MKKKPTFRFPLALAMKSFSGAARCSLEFELPALAAGADDWMLELGEVHESARVILNGEAAGVVFRAPFQTRVGLDLKPGLNRLELEVTNLSANRIIDLDRRLKKWRKFDDVNFVNVNYRRFNVATWRPFASGLLGPARLVPMNSNHAVERSNHGRTQINTDKMGLLQKSRRAGFFSPRRGREIVARHFNAGLLSNVPDGTKDHAPPSQETFARGSR